MLSTPQTPPQPLCRAVAVGSRVGSSLCPLKGVKGFLQPPEPPEPSPALCGLCCSLLPCCTPALAQPSISRVKFCPSLGSSILPLLIPLQLPPPKQGSPFPRAQGCTRTLSPPSRVVASLILTGGEEQRGQHPERWGHHPEYWGQQPEYWEQHLECPLPSPRADHEPPTPSQQIKHHPGGFGVCLEGPGQQQVQPAGHCPHRAIGAHTEPSLGCSWSCTESPGSVSPCWEALQDSSALQECTALSPLKGISLSPMARVRAQLSFQ